jgi:hypothetical protein
MMATTEMHATIEGLLEAVFSVQSIPKIYNEDQLSLLQSLETTDRRAGGWCKMTTSL